jgi:hypothetical protein
MITTNSFRYQEMAADMPRTQWSLEQGIWVRIFVTKLKDTINKSKISILQSSDDGVYHRITESWDSVHHLVL